jgi:hypothetical protein
MTQPTGGTGGTGVSVTTRDEGVLLVAETTSINFVGAGIVATAVGSAVTVTVDGASGSTDYGTAATSVHLQIRRDTAANWTSVNPTLADGEIGYEKDTGKQKIGDGATAWVALAYQANTLVITDADIYSYMSPPAGWIYLPLASEAALPVPGGVYTLAQVNQMICECAGTGFIYMYSPNDTAWRQVGSAASIDIGFFFLGTEITARHIEFNLTTNEVFIIGSGGFNSTAFHISGLYTCHFAVVSAVTRYPMLGVVDIQPTQLGWNAQHLQDYTISFKLKLNDGIAEIHCWPYTEGNLKGGGLYDDGNGLAAVGYVLTHEQYIALPPTPITDGLVATSHADGTVTWETSAGGGIADAPNDGQIYVRRNGAWEVLNIS